MALTSRTKRLKKMSLAALAWRNLFARPGRTVLTLVGIALGVAAVLATAITNRNVASTLDDLFDRTLGSAELQVTPLANRTTIPEQVLDRIRRVPGVRLAVPIIRTQTVLAGTLGEGSVQNSSGQIEIGRSIQVEGIDPEIEPQMRVYTVAAGRMPFKGKYETAIPQAFAEDHDLELGEHLTLVGPAGTVNLDICGLLAAEGAAMANGGGVAFVPMDVVKKIFSLEDGYNEISIQAGPEIGSDPQALSRLKTALENQIRGSARVAYPSARADQVPRMASTYQFTLAFFSVVALFMGGFLIYNTFATSVLERTQEIGVLRAIGMQRRQITGQVLIEAGMLASLGSVLGLGAGVFLAQGLMVLMRGFFQVEGSLLGFSGIDLIESLAVGWAGTLLATYLPARQAASVSPVEALIARSRSEQKMHPAVWLGGFIFAVAGFGLLNIPLNTATQIVLAIRMSGLIVFLMGAILTVPLAVSGLEPVTRRIMAGVFGVMGALGARNVQRSVVRTMVTVASLTISLVMIIEVDSLVFILKQDVSDWLDRALGADLLIRAPYAMEPSFTRTLETITGVQAASPSRTIGVQVAEVPSGRSGQVDDRVYFVAIDPVQYRKVGEKEFVSGQGDPEMAWTAFYQGDAVFVSSVVAEEYDLTRGSRLKLMTHRGKHAFTVAGVTTEFDQDGLIVTGTYSDLRRWFSENGADLFTVQVAEGYDPKTVAGEISDRFEKRKGLQVQDTKTFKSGVMAFYDRLTGLFNVLVLVGIIIGTMGLLNTMTMNVLERLRELGMLRALGSLRRQIVRMVLAEAMSIGIVSVLYGIVFGYILSRVLLTAANLISGYDLHYTFNARPYLISLLIALGVSQLATLLPAQRAGRVNIIQALKHE